MPKFRSKVVEIEAIEARKIMRWAHGDWQALPPWVKEAYEAGNIIFLPGMLHITTLEGTMTAGPDDWIIKGIIGELYPCKDEVFKAKYEPIDE